MLVRGVRSDAVYEAVTLSALLLLMQSAVAAPAIHHVPRLVDSSFATRGTLCRTAIATTAGLRPNDDRRTVAELVGRVASIDVHQFGTEFAGFPAVQRYLATLLGQRPHVSYPTIPWAEGTPLAGWGMLGTVHFAAGPDARLEAAGPHVCLLDSTGHATWWRVAPVDVWAAP